MLDDGKVRIVLKKPWGDGTAAVDLDALAFIGRLAALVPSLPFHLIALVKDMTIAKKILTAMHVACDVPRVVCCTPAAR